MVGELYTSPKTDFKENVSGILNPMQNPMAYIDANEKYVWNINRMQWLMLRSFSQWLRSLPPKAEIQCLAPMCYPCHSAPPFYGRECTVEPKAFITDPVPQVRGTTRRFNQNRLQPDFVTHAIYGRAFPVCFWRVILIWELSTSSKTQLLRKNEFATRWTSHGLGIRRKSWQNLTILDSFSV